MYKKISGFTFSTKIFLVAALVFLFAGGGFMAFADTIGPNVTALTPALGSTVESLAPQFSMRFDDVDKLDSGVIVLQVDGQNVSPVTVAWDGIYQTYYDSCSGSSYSVRIGDDYTKGTINAQLPTLTEGQHTVYYKIKDRAGNYSENTYNFTIADNSGPQFSECSPANSAVIATGYPVIKAKITDPNGVDPSSIRLTINGGEPVTVTFDNLTGTLTYKPSQVLRNGSYQVQAAASDTLNNPSSFAWSFNVNDTAVPVISNFIPADNSFVNPTTPVIEAKISDLSGIVNPVALKIDGNDFSANWNSGTGKVSYPLAGALSAGNHTVAVTAYDEQGNGTTAFWGFIVDSAGPLLTDIQPAAGQVEALRPLISIRFSDPAQLAGAELKIDGTSVNPQIAWDGIYQTQYDSCTGDAYSVRVGDDYTKGVVTGQCPKQAQGNHTISYKFTDKVGNVTQDYYNINISDVTGPGVTGAAPANGSVIASGNPTIKATLTDANLIVAGSVYMYLNDNLVSATFDQTTRTVSYNAPQPLLNGEYRVDVAAADELGNARTNSWSFTVSDVAPPSITGLTPVSGAIISDAKPAIGASITDPSGIKNPVYVQLDENLYETGYNASTGKAIYVPLQPLSAGSHTVSLAAYDYQGQRAVATWSFYLDQIGPAVTVVSPAAGSTVSTVSPKISMRVTDPSGVDKLKFRMLLDGILVNAAMEYDGIYQTYYDSCSGGDIVVRVGDDLTKASINYQTAKLANQQEHSVELYVYDKIGNAGYAGWAFTVHDAEPPVVTALMPAPGSTLENSSPAISAKVSDNNEIDPQKVFITINDGQPVGAFNSGTGTVTYTPAEPLPNGSYTIKVTAEDMYGNRKVETWYFSVQHLGAPGITDMKPPNGSGTRDVRPTVSARVTDDRGIDLSKLSLTIDGKGVNATFTPDDPGSITAGTVYGIPADNLATGMHNVTLTVFDLNGNIKQAIWQFGVNKFGDMNVAGNCTDCHNEGIAAIEQEHLAGADNCALCHEYTVVGWEPDCCYCHDGAHTTSWPPPIGAYQCTQCHNSDLSWVIPTHGSANELNVHNNTQLADNCKSCHSAYLTREHNVYVDGSGYAYDCNTCHKSTNPAVSNAISAGDTTCGACHGDQGNHEAVHVSSIDQNCQGCHQQTLTTEHILSANLTCDTCHQSPVTAVTRAIALSQKQCTACHAAGHNLKFADPVSSDIPLYSGVKWSQEMDARIFAGEFWMTDEFLNGGRVLISDRANMQGQTVWTYYQQEMAAKGWALAAVEPSAPTDSFTATFTKGSGQAIIWFYAGENRATAPPLEKGARLEILYKLN